MGVASLQRSELSDIGAVQAPFASATPLWFYVLAEARCAVDGLHLGPGRWTDRGRDPYRIVPAMASAPVAQRRALASSRSWAMGLAQAASPSPTIAGDRSYTRAHFLHYAGVLQQGDYRWPT